jgi:uncharacterized membrane protein
VTNAKVGILIGAVLAIVGIEYGFWPFVFVAVAMAIGAMVGRFADGKLDPTSLVDVFRGKRSSS